MHPTRLRRSIAAVVALALALVLVPVAGPAFAAGGTISGTVRDSAGVGIADVTVTGSGLTTTTAADGTYSLAVPAGSYEVRFEKLPYLERSWAASDEREYDLIGIAEGEARTGIDRILYLPTSVTTNTWCDDCGYFPGSDRVHGVVERRLANGTWISTSSQPYGSGPEAIVFPLAPGTYRILYFEYLNDSLENYARQNSPVFTVVEGVAQALPDVMLRHQLERDLTDDTVTVQFELTPEGIPDLVARKSDGKLIVYPGNGYSSFKTPITTGTGWGSYTALFRAGGFDRPGDLIGRDSSGRLWLFHRYIDGQYLPRIQIGTGWNKFNLLFSPGDWVAGYADVMGRDSAGGLWLYQADGNGGFYGGTRIGTGWQKMTAVFGPGDMDLDGNVDIIARDASGYLWLYRGDGLGGFLPGKTKIGSGWKSFTAVFSVGDFNTDGKPDVIGRKPNGELWLYKGTGTGTLTNGVRIGTGWANLRIVM